MSRSPRSRSRRRCSADGWSSVQNRFSPVYRKSMPELEYCGAHGIAFLPWSPLGGIGNGEAVFAEQQVFADVAAELGVSPQQVTLAWELALGEHVIPIPGCSRPASIADSARAAELELTLRATGPAVREPAGHLRAPLTRGDRSGRGPRGQRPLVQVAPAEPGGLGDLAAGILQPDAVGHERRAPARSPSGRSASGSAAPSTTTQISPFTPAGGPLRQFGGGAALDLLEQSSSARGTTATRPVAAERGRDIREARRRAGSATRRTPWCAARRASAASALRRSPPLRGRNPSKQNRSVGSPDTRERGQHRGRSGQRGHRAPRRRPRPPRAGSPGR